MKAVCAILILLGLTQAAFASSNQECVKLLIEFAGLPDDIFSRDYIGTNIPVEGVNDKKCINTNNHSCILTAN